MSYQKIIAHLEDPARRNRIKYNSKTGELKVGGRIIVRHNVYLPDTKGTPYMDATGTSVRDNPVRSYFTLDQLDEEYSCKTPHRYDNTIDARILVVWLKTNKVIKAKNIAMRDGNLANLAWDNLIVDYDEPDLPPGIGWMKKSGWCMLVPHAIYLGAFKELDGAIARANEIGFPLDKDRWLRGSAARQEVAHSTTNGWRFTDSFQLTIKHLPEKIPLRRSHLAWRKLVTDGANRYLAALNANQVSPRGQAQANMLFSMLTTTRWLTPEFAPLLPPYLSLMAALLQRFEGTTTTKAGPSRRGRKPKSSKEQ